MIREKTRTVKMIVDLHAHTNFSKDAADDPEELIKKMIESGVQVFGITDHNHWIKGIEKEQNAAIRKLAEKYKDKIKIYCGIELSTRPSWELCDFSVPKAYDYALIENVDEAESVTGGDLFGYAEKVGIPCGVAHTDLFGFAKRLGVPADEYFKKMAEKGIFWEMNVNYDSTHGYREHEYVKRFFASEEEQKVIRNAGVYLSVGFDGHRMIDYDVNRVKTACDKIEALGLNLKTEF